MISSWSEKSNTYMVEHVRTISFKKEFFLSNQAICLYCQHIAPKDGCYRGLGWPFWCQKVDPKTLFGPTLASFNWHFNRLAWSDKKSHIRRDITDSPFIVIISMYLQSRWFCDIVPDITVFTRIFSAEKCCLYQSYCWIYLRKQEFKDYARIVLSPVFKTSPFCGICRYDFPMNLPTHLYPFF